MKLIKWMSVNCACNEASIWVGDKTPKQAWKMCNRGDWMLWALGRTLIDKREVVRIACDIALSVLPLMDDPRVAAAIDAAEGWCEGTVTLAELQNARRGAVDAYDAAIEVANAAAYAADAAIEVANAAAYAADAAPYAARAVANGVYFNAARTARAAIEVANAAARTARAAIEAWQQAKSDSFREIADLVRARVSATEFNRLITESMKSVIPS